MSNRPDPTREQKAKADRLLRDARLAAAVGDRRGAQKMKAAAEEILTRKR